MISPPEHLLPVPESSETPQYLTETLSPGSCRFQSHPLPRSHASLRHAPRKYAIVHAAQYNLVLHSDYSV